MTTLTRLLTNKTELQHSRVEAAPLPAAAPDEAVLAIGRVALTTNNITYAAFGDSMRYWDFFPTGAEGWGHMPAWGFADVVSSGVDGVDIGDRFYGYFPIASHLVMKPVRVSERGFYDGLAHRRELTSAYNQYTRCSADPVYRAEDENLQMLLRPLFITSYFLADFLQDNAFFGATRVVVSSASSKTAYGTAFCVQGQARLKLTGLTAPRNHAFVEKLGCYAETVDYAALESLPVGEKTLYVDFSGDNALRARVHRHFGDTLVHDCYAGSTQNTQLLGQDATALPGPRPVFYFAPHQIRKRNDDWGTAVVNQRFGDAQKAFIRHVGDAGWLRLAEHRGFEAAQGLIDDLCNGRADPQLGHVVVL